MPPKKWNNYQDPTNHHKSRSIQWSAPTSVSSDLFWWIIMYICACKSCTYQTPFIFCPMSIMWVISSIRYFIVRCSRIQQSYPTKILSKSCGNISIYLYVWTSYSRALEVPFQKVSYMCHFQSCVNLSHSGTLFPPQSVFWHLLVVIFNIHPFWSDQESFNTIRNMYSIPGLYFVPPDGVFAVTSGCDLLCDKSTISNICAVELVQQLAETSEEVYMCQTWNWLLSVLFTPHINCGLQW